MIDSKPRNLARKNAEQAAGFLSRHPVTLLVMMITGLCFLAMPQIARQFSTLPPLPLIFENANRDSWLGVGLWVYVGLLASLYLAVVFVVSSSADVPGENRLLERLGRRIRTKIRPSLETLLYNPAKRLSRRQRLVFGGVFLFLGALAFWLSYRLSDLIAHAGPPIATYWAIFLLMVGAWLVFGEFDADATSDESDANKRHWAKCTRTTGLLVLLFMMNGIIGWTIWTLAAGTLEPLPLSWRIYTLWALVHVGLAALGLGLFADAVGRTVGQRLGVFAALLLVLVLPKSSVPIGYEAQGRSASYTRSRDEVRKGARAPLDAAAGDKLESDLTEKWFAAVNARLAKMPKTEPVLFVAAAGGGSRAALYATLVLEMLERTPPHGSLDDWTEVETPDRALADQVLFVSSVSGGSLASAHYVLHDTRDAPTVADYPRNTLLTQLNDTFCSELVRLCETQSRRCLDEQANQINDGRECVVAQRLCTKSPDGFQVLEFNANAAESVDSCRAEVKDEAPNWPVGSARFDDMATDFNAPLLRGIVMPGVERGEMVTHFWRKTFGWREVFESATHDDGARPLLLVNVTDVLGGSRFVAGFPRLPNGLLKSPSGQAKAITDIDPRLAVDVEEAVRMSANFPWGFDLPLVGLGASQQRTERVIDGGVLDNSGIDTFTVLLDRLEDLSGNVVEASCDTEPSTLGCRARELLSELARRGVVLLEIDSGAKPQEPGLFARILSNVLLPVHALSTSSYTRSVEASQFHSGRLQAVLRRRMNGLLDQDWEKQTQGGEFNDDVNLVGKRLAHVVYVLDTANLMTAWALSPEEKAELLARFLAEDARQRLELRDQFEDIEGANVARADLFSRAVTDAKLRTFLLNLSGAMEELIRREREAIARDAERRRSYYESLDNEPTPVTEQESAPVRSGWVFVGYYHDDTSIVLENVGPLECDNALEPHRWLLNYLDFLPHRAPPSLQGQTLKTSAPLKLHRSLPDESGNFNKRAGLGVIARGASIEIESIEAWAETGFYFANVNVINEPSD